MNTPVTKEHIAQWHALFQSLADLTAGAADMAEVAGRYLNNPCLHESSTDPFWEASNLQNLTTAFIEHLADQFFDPSLHGNWSKEEQAQLGAPEGGH